MGTGSPFAMPSPRAAVRVTACVALFAATSISRAAAQTTTRASVNSSGQQSDFTNRAPAISGDARFIAFDSDATNLVAGDTNGVSDVFVRDTLTGQTTRVS